MNTDVITLDVQVQKCLSRKSRIRVEADWPYGLTLPVPGDKILLDRYELLVTEGPASDEVLLDRPGLVVDGIWKCNYSGEWAHAEMLAKEFSTHMRCRSVRLLS